MSTKIIIPVLIVLVAVGGGAFYGGTVYAKSKGDARAAGRGAAAFAGGAFAGRGGAAGGARNGGGFTAGEVLSKDATSITLKLSDGGSKNVFLSASTTVSMMTAGSLDDVKTGTNVTITGAANQDGSVTASAIQIRPAGAPAARQFPTQ